MVKAWLLETIASYTVNTLELSGNKTKNPWKPCSVSILAIFAENSWTPFIAGFAAISDKSINHVCNFYRTVVHLAVDGKAAECIIVHELKEDAVGGVLKVRMVEIACQSWVHYFTDVSKELSICPDRSHSADSFVNAKAGKKQGTSGLRGWL